MKRVLLDRSSLDRDDLDLKALTATLPDWAVYGNTPPERVPERIGAAHVVVTNKVPIDAAAMEAAPGLRLIAVAATGTNNVDLEAAVARLPQTSMLCLPESPEIDWV